ncbi:MAG: DUF29 domain-containing protein [Stellaceae bacterium]
MILSPLTVNARAETATFAALFSSGAAAAAARSEEGRTAMGRNSALYDEDFFAWTQEQARLLREGALSEIDIENIAEELECMGKSNRRELRSRLIVLLMHLLKCRFQADRISPSWRITIRHQRDEIDALLTDSPSLRPEAAEMLARAYEKARQDAIDETGLPSVIFPAECP